MENFSEGPIGGQKCQTAQISQHKQGFNLLSTKNSNYKHTFMKRSVSSEMHQTNPLSA